jgi:hypothetical protein
VSVWVVAFGLLGSCRNAVLLLVGADVVVEVGEALGELGGVVVGIGFCGLELFDVLGEFGTTGVFGSAEALEVVFGVAALFGGVGGAFGCVVPLGFDLRDVVYGSGLFAELGEVGFCCSDVLALFSVSEVTELLGVTFGGLAFLGESVDVTVRLIETLV